MLDKMLIELEGLGIETEVSVFCKKGVVWYAIRYRESDQDPWSAMFAENYRQAVDRLQELKGWQD